MMYKEFINPKYRFDKRYIKIAKESSPPSPNSKNFDKLLKLDSDHKSKCRYINPETNIRFKNHLGIYPKFCYSHSLSIDNLYLDESQIKKGGIGLFTGPYGFQKNQIIGKYGDNINYLSPKTYDERCTTNEKCYTYIFCKGSFPDPKNKCWDASDIRSTITRYINDAYGSKFKNNCHFEIIKDDVYIIASKNIKPLRELFISYGTNYWN